MTRSTNKRWINTCVQYELRDGQFVEVKADGYWYEGDVSLAHTVANIDQSAYRWRDDDGTESTATWLELLDTTHAFDLSSGNVQTRLRFIIAENAGGSSNNFTGSLEFQINGGGYTLIGAATTGAIYYNSANLTDGSDTTQQLGVGTFITPNAGVIEVGTGGGIADFSGNDEVEYEYTIELVAADLADGDTLDFRINEVDTITSLASATITKSAPPDIVTVPKATWAVFSGQALSLKADESVLVNKATWAVLSGQSTNLAEQLVVVKETMQSLVGQGYKLNESVAIASATFASLIGQNVDLLGAEVVTVVPGTWKALTGQNLTASVDIREVIASGAWANLVGQTFALYLAETQQINPATFAQFIGKSVTVVDGTADVLAENLWRYLDETLKQKIAFEETDIDRDSP